VDKESLADELEKLSNQLSDLRKKIEAVDNIISGRKSIQSLLGFFGLILLLFFFTLVGGIILTIALGMLDQYSNIFLITISILALVWIVYFVGSRIIIKNISTNSILRDNLAEQLEETKSEIDKTELLIEKEEQTLKEPQNEENVPGARVQSVESKQTDKGNNKFSGPSAAVERGTKKEAELSFEEEQKKKGLIKFVPIRLQIRELMAEEGHDKAFDSKISKKWKEPKDVPLEITWGTPEQVFEWTQKEKGYIKFVEDGKVRWGTEEQVAKWQKEKKKKARD
jgi:hypothetical protein